MHVVATAIKVAVLINSRCTSQDTIRLGSRVEVLCFLLNVERIPLGWYLVLSRCEIKRRQGEIRKIGNY